MKLALGCVQFGMPYGVANAAGKVSEKETREILSAAHYAGVDTLDTASSYGDSESNLGEFGIKDWKVITKLRPILPECHKIADWVITEIHGSCRRLKVDAVEGVLIHHLPDLFSKKGLSLVEGLQKAQTNGLTKRIGVSIYSPEDLDRVASLFWPEIVQAPFNILDRRLLDSGWATKLEEAGSQIHIRSVFLQGLLLMNPADRPEKFKKFDAVWKMLDAFCAKQDKTSLQFCLQYALSHAEFQRVVVGVASKGQLLQLLEAAGEKIHTDFDPEIEIPQGLIDPRCWNNF